MAEARADRVLVRDWMESRNFNQSEAAGALGCSRSFLSQWFSNDPDQVRQLSPKMQIAWADAIAKRLTATRYTAPEVRAVLRDGRADEALAAVGAAG